MDQTPYLRIRYQRDEHSCGVTLSIPSGLERALTLDRLPKDAEAQVTESLSWVPLRSHPSAVPIVARLQPKPEPAFGPIGNDADYQTPKVVLLDPNEVTKSEEYARFLAASDEQDRRAAMRSVVRVRESQPAKVIVAGGEKEEVQATLWRRQINAVQRWAAAL